MKELEPLTALPPKAQHVLSVGIGLLEVMNMIAVGISALPVGEP